MLRIIFIMLIVLHGLIHLMGFAKAFGLAEIQQLKLPISKTAGVLWLGAALLFLATSIDFYLMWKWWWVLALAGVVLSQILVIIYWKDAKFATIPNIIILIGALLA